jgi:spore coat protein U-like protein
VSTFSRASRLAAALTLAGVEAMASAATCNVQSAGVAFGAYDSLDSAPLDGVGSIDVDCDSAIPFTVDLGPGAGTYNERLLTAGSSRLSYNLYTDAGRTSVWGDGIGASDLSASGAKITLPIYGRIPGGQAVPPGLYLDTIAVTISY